MSLMLIPYILYVLAVATVMLFVIDFKVSVGRTTRERLHGDFIAMDEKIAHRICLLKYATAFGTLGVLTNLVIAGASL